MKKSKKTEFEKKVLAFLDWNALEKQMFERNVTETDLIDNKKISFNTLKKIRDGKGIYPAVAKRLSRFLNCSYMDLLSSGDRRYESLAPPNPSSAGFAEWVVDDHNRTPHRASNELIYVISKMKHQHTANRRGRGKYYVLSGLQTKVREEWRHKLGRHADVCAAVRQNRNIALNLSSAPTPDNEGWWVIDDWVGEQTLEGKCKKGSCPPSEMPQLLLDIASGLHALHSAGVIFRELHPSRVLISDLDGHAVLTDFELGKLLDGGPSVSSEWQDDHFRAPEVDSGNFTHRADLYSFGKTALFAAAGRIDDDADASQSFTQVGMPTEIAEYLLKCLESGVSRRPENVAIILKDLELWATKGR